MSLSVIILCKNEENNIERCLKSVEWADEIVVVDSYSNDSTLDICKKYTDNIYIKKFRNMIVLLLRKLFKKLSIYQNKLTQISIGLVVKNILLIL